MERRRISNEKDDWKIFDHRQKQFQTFCAFLQCISPLSLFDLASVRLFVIFGKRFENETNGQLLWEWLNTPRADGRPKLLNFYLGFNMMEQLKTVSGDIWVKIIENLVLIIYFSSNKILFLHF